MTLSEGGAKMTATMVEVPVPLRRIAEIQQALREIPGLDGTPRSFDELATTSGLSSGELSAQLMKAVAAGAASKLPGGYYARS